jgi:calcineurin-like phosphoesterase family protein
MYFFTADEHYNHAAIIGYCHRPFKSITKMNEQLIVNHNQVVTKKDIVVHCGDFGFFHSADEAQKMLRRLNGNHILLKGSHDGWMPSSAKHMWRKTVDGQFIFACHYAMRTWERACHGAWQVYGHSHGDLPPIGKQWDVGVDNNDFFPVSFEKLKIIMTNQPVLHEVEHDRPKDSAWPYGEFEF